MAYRNSTFYPVGNQSGRDHAPAKYIYRTDDSIATITATDYFDDIKSRLSMGDEIEVQFVTFTSATDDTFTAEHGKTKLVVAYKGNDLMHILEVGKSSSIVFGTMTDLSTAGTALGGGAATNGNLDIVSSVAGNVTKIVTILGGTITVGDAIITTGNETTDVAYANSSITVANAGSAKGNVDSSTPSDASIDAGDTIRLTSNGGSTVAQELFVMIEVEEELVGSNKIYISSYFADVSAVSSSYIAAPAAGTITKMWMIFFGLTAGGDTTMTGFINGIGITDGVMTDFQPGLEGEVNFATPTALNVVAAGDSIRVTSNGGTTNATAATITYEITLD